MYNCLLKLEIQVRLILKLTNSQVHGAYSAESSEYMGKLIQSDPYGIQVCRVTGSEQILSDLVGTDKF